MPVKRVSDFDNADGLQNWLLSYGIFVPFKDIERAFRDLDKGTDWRFQVWPGKYPNQWRLTTAKRRVKED